METVTHGVMDLNRQRHKCFFAFFLKFSRRKNRQQVALGIRQHQVKSRKIYPRQCRNIKNIIRHIRFGKHPFIRFCIHCRIGVKKFFEFPKIVITRRPQNGKPFRFRMKHRINGEKPFPIPELTLIIQRKAKFPNLKI